MSHLVDELVSSRKRDVSGALGISRPQAARVFVWAVLSADQTSQ